MKDIYAPANPLTLTRTATIAEIGTFRLARRSAELQKIQMINPGGWVRLKIDDGKGRTLVEVPSTFTGSFPFGCEMEDGIIVTVTGRGAPILTFCWREPDRKML